MPRHFTMSAIIGSLLVSACGGSTATPVNSRPAESTSPEPETSRQVATIEPFAVEQIESSPKNVTLSGLNAWQIDFVGDAMPAPLVEFDEIRSGGPPPDGIPPIDEPRFLPAAAVDFLADNEPVLALDLGGEARAYPVQILTWHEIVNDTVGGVPVSVSYCPLCNSAVAYDRRVGDQIVDFGTSGLLWNSALVMYDRQTETLWSHFNGMGIVGELTGVELEDFPLSTVAWSAWRDAHPEGLVLSRETGFDRDYGRNPYPGYDDVDGVPFLFEGEVDGRFTAMTRIVGIERDGRALSIPLADLEEMQVLATSLGTEDMVIWWTPGTASALDASAVADGYDVGATAAFTPVAGGMSLTFETTGDGSFIDVETSSRWDFFGRAIDGPLAGEQLAAVSHVDTFWFAWSTFRPDTVVVTSAPASDS